jgi:putative acetyltransferase
VIVRPERPADVDAVAAVIEAAFGRRLEAELAESIRASSHYVPELALVAEEEGEVIGHVMFSYVALTGGAARKVLLLSPLAVLPGRQRQGTGQALVKEGIKRIDERGEPMIVVEGIPAYYPQFGFKPARDFGLEPPSEHIPDAAFMVLPLSNYDASYRGRIVYPPAFDVV